MAVPDRGSTAVGSSREGMFEGLSIGNYLLLVDYTGRLFREGKARISAELAGILDRIGSSAESWQLRMEKLRNGPMVRPFLRGQPRKVTRNGQTPQCATLGQPRRVRGPVTRR